MSWPRRRTSLRWVSCTHISPSISWKTRASREGAPVHHVEGPSLRHDLVEEVHVMHIPAGDADKCGNVAVQVQQGVHLDGGLAPAKLRPRKQRQAQVDGGRIQSVQTLLQIDANRIAGMQRPGDGDQNLREVGVDPPVACFVGISQGRARHLAAESHVVELAADGTKARFDVAKTLAVGQLSERHRQILIPTGQIFQIAITPVAGYALLELLVRKELDQLGEDGAPSVHPALSLAPQQIPSNTLLTPFLFQIVLTPTRMHHTESKKRARSLWEFPRTAVILKNALHCSASFLFVCSSLCCSWGFLTRLSILLFSCCCSLAVSGRPSSATSRSSEPCPV